MSELDDRILRALNAEERELLDKYKEPPILNQVLFSFRGQMGIVMAITLVLGLAITTLMGFCIYYYFYSTDPEVRQLAMIGFICGVTMTGFVKLFYYNNLGQLNIIREIKRLELQVSLLAERKQ